jgi:response regulator RpfG family c-di-GMP phosphodiesterase
MDDRGPNDKKSVLLVDDDAASLRGLVRDHRDRYALTTALTARQALELMERRGFPVVVASFLMAETDGAQLLATVAEQHPDAVRILIAQPVAVGTLASAVNRAQPFRLLARPFPPEAFREAVDAAFRSAGRRAASRRRDQERVAGTVRMLSEILFALRPESAAWSERLLTRIRTVLPHVPEGVDEEEIEATVRLSSIEDLVSGRRLGADHLLSRVPGLVGVGRAIRFRRHRYDGGGQDDGPRREGLPLGSRLLHIAADLDALEQQGHPPHAALDLLEARPGRYDPLLLGAFAGALGGRAPRDTIDTVSLAGLSEGMILASDVVDERGTVVLVTGQRLTDALISRLQSYTTSCRVLEPIRVRAAFFARG